MIAFLCGLLLCGVALCIPEISDQFTSDITVAVPWVGSQDGVMYYDRVMNRQRQDFTSRWGTNIQLDDGNNEVTFNIQCSRQGQCECTRADTFSPIWELNLPPFSEYVGDEVIEGETAQHWHVEMGQVVVDEWVVVDESAEPKEPSYPVKFIANAMGMTTEVLFSEMDVDTPLTDDLFDGAQWNCPAPVPPVFYTVTGSIQDSTNLKAIQGATVTAGDYSAVTNSRGVYTLTDVLEIDAPYTFTVQAEGYTPESFEVVVDHNIQSGTSADAFLSPKLPVGSYRFVLTWKDRPRDLDLYVKDANGCTTYFGHKQCTSGARLDVDKRQGWGPETITIDATTTSPSYTVWVKQYSSDSHLSLSGAKVDLYSSVGHVDTMSVPADCAESSKGLAIGKLLPFENTWNPVVYCF
ncbi:hypothetical protein KIPB_009482 [Kipferlia bialata]|uniref:Carboxypeptidase regulatory-like domain-containing protein n=1 Tax=Kipferlia bialata TaxID=797122 RepID=A0A9K3D3P2_9EUKA|nr:hypothetical protein KIPB_009482 [Kipferlia bialata]|eukprot:g9482.t1